MRLIVRPLKSTFSPLKSTLGARRNIVETVVSASFAFPSVMTTSVAVSLASAVAYAIEFYKVSEAHEKIVVTGPFIGDKEMKICKTTLILPFQKYTYISNQAHSIQTHVSAMTKEKIPFDMPMYFTICPDDSTEEKLSLYAKKFGTMSRDTIDATIESVVHGEARLLTGGMDVEHIFSNRAEFKRSITDKIQECLQPFGIKVDNVNIGELNDSKGSDYFKNLRERALQQAIRDANVATAEHTNKADSEIKAFEGDKRKKVAEAETDAVTRENELQQTIVKSKTELAIFAAAQNRQAELAKLEAAAITTKKDIDLKTEIAMKEREQMIEQQKAAELSKAIVDKEKLLVETSARAEQIKQLADADMYKAKMVAEALLYTKQKEAEGISVVQAALALGLKQNVDAAGGVREFQSYLMVDGRQHVEIAEKYSDAVKGMKPTIFTNGSEGSVSKVMTDIGGTAAALANAYKQQTGIDLAELATTFLSKKESA